jgi:ankyrin repeat protein
VQEEDDMQRTALHWACELGHQDMAELLVRRGASLDTHDQQVQTPLDLSLKSDVATAVRLVQVLADVKFEEYLADLRLDESMKAYKTAIVLACGFNRLAIVQGLVDAGADVNERSMNSPLAIAVRYSSWDVVQYLLSKGAAVQTIALFDLQELDKKMAGARAGSEYQDAAEKITLLSQYGLNFERMVNVPLDPSRLGFRRLGYR